MKAVEENQWEVAYQQADLGLQLNPQNEEGWRIMARVYTEARMDRALFYWQELEKRKKLTQTDRGYYLQLLLILKRLDLAAKQWEALRGFGDRLSEREIILGIEYYRLTQKNQEAIALLRKVSHESHLKYQYLLGQFLLFDSSLESRKEGEGILRRLSNSNEIFGIQSAELLLGIKELSEQDFVIFTKKIQGHPLYSFRYELLILENEIRRQPGGSGVRIEKVFLDWNKGLEKEEDRLLLGQWLNRQKQYNLTLKLLSDSVSKKSAALLLVRLDAAAAQKKWALVLDCLNLQPSPLEPYLIELFRARSFMELKRNREAEAAWEKTFHLVKYQPIPLQFAADYAVQVGAFSEAKRMYLQMSRFPNYLLESQRQLLYLAEKEGKMSEMILCLERILELTPESLAAKNDLAYIYLLENREIDRCLDIAKSLVKEDPTSLAYRSTLALAYLKRGESREAFQVYHGLSIDWKMASPVARWIFYLTLKANHQEEFASRFEGYIKGITIRKQEKELIQLLSSPIKQ